MDEIKKWGLQQLPGYEAIEEEPKEPEDFYDTKEVQKDEESIVYKISNKDFNNDDIYPDDDHPVHMNKTDFEKILMESDYRNREKYEIKINKYVSSIFIFRLYNNIKFYIKVDIKSFIK